MDEKVKTWTLRQGASWFVTESLDDAVVEIGEHTPGFKITIEATEHTRAELDAMPDFNGF